MEMRKNWQMLQKEFMNACNTTISKPNILTRTMPVVERKQVLQALSLCHSLINEEVNVELLHDLNVVLGRNDLIRHTGDTYLLSVEELHTIVDDIVDSIYVICQLANTLGIHIDPFYREVHRANMTKTIGGKVQRREDGKILKPEGWTPPQSMYILEDQISDNDDGDRTWQVEVSTMLMQMRELCKLDHDIDMMLKNNERRKVAKIFENVASSLTILAKELSDASNDTST